GPKLGLASMSRRGEQEDRPSPAGEPALGVAVSDKCLRPLVALFERIQRVVAGEFASPLAHHGDRPTEVEGQRSWEAPYAGHVGIGRERSDGGCQLPPRPLLGDAGPGSE